ncbi:MAG TPA: hypothetical protein VMI12_04955 [Puia sp.]|nr:hypothetical protein [Puia sp.]
MKFNIHEGFEAEENIGPVYFIVYLVYFFIRVGFTTFAPHKIMP